MDFNEKQAARSKWRLSQQHKNVHGGRTRAKGHPQHASQLPAGPADLETNTDRYGSSDEDEHLDEGVARQSEGGDLAQLLAETEQFYAQAHFRYRSFIDNIDTQPPPVDIAALEKELAIEVEPLMQALSVLPLSEVLGIPAELLLKLPPGPSSEDRLQQQQQQDKTQVDDAHSGSDAITSNASSAASQSATFKHQSQTQLTGNAVAGNAVAGNAAAGESGAAVPLDRLQPKQAAEAAASGGGVDDDNDDEELLKLLTGDSSNSPDTLMAGADSMQPAAVRNPIASSSAGSQHSTAAGTRRSTISQDPAGLPLSTVELHKSMVAASPLPAGAAPASAQGGVDDALDDLLAATAVAHTQVAARAVPGRDKKQSLQQWLDEM